MGDIMAVSGSTQDPNDNSGIFTQVRGRRKKSKKSDTIDSVVDSVASQHGTSNTMHAATVVSDDSQATSMIELRKVDDLTSTVLSQKETY